MEILKRLGRLAAVGIPLGSLLLLQWPFKWIAEALDGPIERYADRANKLTEDQKP